jgi:hypothetical protein
MKIRRASFAAERWLVALCGCADTPSFSSGPSFCNSHAKFHDMQGSVLELRDSTTSPQCHFVRGGEV